MKAMNEMKLRFPSRSANEGLARSAVASFISQLDPAVDELIDVRTAVSEAVTNCIVHAYPDDIGEITITARLYQSGRVVIKVRDKGVGIEDVKQAMSRCLQREVRRGRVSGSRLWRASPTSCAWSRLRARERLSRLRNT